MTAFICLLTLLPQVLPGMNKLPKPVNVTLTSDHFNHTLKWEPGPGTPTGVYYTVTVTDIAQGPWMSVAGCERVQRPLICNLSQAFSDTHQTYMTQITAQLDARTSESVVCPEFEPIKDTHLELPLLTVTACGRNLCVDLQPPMEHLREIYESLQYKLRIQHSGAERIQDTSSLQREILKDLGPGKQYCVSVCFLDILRYRKCNYSQPVCAFTPSSHTTDPAIAAVLCLLVMFAVVFVVLMASAGYICLRRKPLPLVLTSIRHLEDVLVLAPHNTSLLSLLNLKPIAPSSGEKWSSQTLPDESDGEMETENTGGSVGGAYKLRLGTNLLSSSSSSSSSLSAPLSPEPEPKPSSTSVQTSEVFDPPPVAPSSAETRRRAGLNDELSTHVVSRSPPESDQRASDPPAGSDSVTARRIEPEKEETEAVGEEGNQEVNLLTLTFGRHEEEDEEESHVDMAEMEPESSSASEMHNTTPLLPAQTWDSQDIDIEPISCPDNEEEEEDSGYIERPCLPITVHGGKMGSWLLLLLHLHLGNAPWIGAGEEAGGLNAPRAPLPAPSNVSISSFNMEHTLSFLPGPETPSSTRFAVEILRLRKKSWRAVADCSKLTAGQTCNLTRAFKDPFDLYHARVQAFTAHQTSNWTVSGEFQPLSDTVLGPPEVSVSGCGNCLLLRLNLPIRGVQQLQNLHREFIVHVRRTRDGAQFGLTLDYKEEIMITYLEPGVEYCVTVAVKTLFNSNTVTSKPHCAFTSPPPPTTSLYVVYSLLGAFCSLGFLLLGLVVYCSQLSVELLRPRPPRTLLTDPAVCAGTSTIN
ncbi:cytokine receptor family member b2 [Chelmon rostratus]|uniref:cytokine receptor family member b2 n=1 Tax=Chelmon rostratus TaxID=109905 RepID=UPI001BE6D97F|nr:cytokine receptor family member b2 [Chelmon rostratus]